MITTKRQILLSCQRDENMKIAVISYVVGALGIVPKGREKELEIRGRNKTIQTTTLLRSP